MVLILCFEDRRSRHWEIYTKTVLMTYSVSGMVLGPRGTGSSKFPYCLKTGNRQTKYMLL